MIEVGPRDRLTFKSAVDSWTLCVPRLLVYKAERAAALVETEAQMAELKKLRAKLREDILAEARRFELPVPQVAGGDLYTGEIIAGRFQVLGSVVPAGTFYVCDHRRDDLLVREGGLGSATKRFATVAEAEEWISQFTSGAGHDTGIPGSTTQEAVMAKPAVKTAPKPGRETLPKITAKSPKAAPVETKAPAAPKAGKAPATVTELKPAAKAPRDSAATMFKSLIMEGKLTDDQIFANVADKFGLDEKKRTYVAWYRNYLTKQGENPPAAKVTK